MESIDHHDIVLILYVLAPVSSIALLFAYWRRIGGRPGGALRVAIVNLLVAAVAISSVVLCGELYFRFFYDTTDAFGRANTARRWQERHYQLNALGMRDDRGGYRKPPVAGRPRVSFVGDSFAAGYGVADVDLRFANRVRTARPDWEIHVLARNGWNTPDQIRFLENFPGRYRTDWMVLVYNLNDASDIGARWQAMADEIYENDLPRYYLGQHGYFINWLHFRWIAATRDQANRYFALQSDAHGSGPMWRRQRERLRRVDELARRAGGRLLVVTFPSLHALGADYPYAPVHAALDDEQ